MPNPITAVLNSVTGGIIGQIGSLLDGISTTDEERLKAKAELATISANLQVEMAKVDAQIADAQSKVLVAEAQSESWLTRNWRPILMLSFTAILLYNYVFALMFSLPTVAMPLDLWGVIKLGVGGYIIGRTGENLASYAPDVVQAWRGPTPASAPPSMPLADVGNANK